MPLDPEHYCIQAKRIEKIDKKMDDLGDKFEAGGLLWTMSEAIKRLEILAETNIVPRVEDTSFQLQKTSNQVKWLIFVVAGLTAVIGTLLGVKVPL